MPPGWYNIYIHTMYGGLPPPVKLESRHKNLPVLVQHNPQSRKKYTLHGPKIHVYNININDKNEKLTNVRSIKY